MTLVLNTEQRKRWFDGQRFHSVGTITASGSYVTGGDILRFADSEIKSSRIPENVEIHGIAGWQYSYEEGADQTLGKMLAHFAGVEEGAGAYDAAIIADTITYHAIFRMR